MASTFTINQSGKVGKKINITYYQYGNTVRFFLDDTPTSQIQILFIATNGSGISDIITLDSDNVLYALKSSAMRYDSQLTGVDTITSVNTGRTFQLSLLVENRHDFLIGVHMEFNSYTPYLNSKTVNCNGANSSALQTIDPGGVVRFTGEFLQAESPTIKLWIDNNLANVRELQGVSIFVPGLTFPGRLWFNEEIPFSATTSFPSENNNYNNPLRFFYQNVS